MKFSTPQNDGRPASLFLKAAFTQVDNSPLILFRIIFGFLLLYSAITKMLSGYISDVFIKPPFTFNFIGFDFLQPLPGNGMYWYFGAMAVLSLLVMVGGWYRFAIIGHTLLWVGIYLMQKSYYNNHYYLILLLSFLLIFMPAHRYCSLDVKRGAVAPTLTCPQWVSWLFIGQVAIVYFYAGIAKLNPDWLSGRFLATQLSKTGTQPIIGALFKHHLFHLLVSYGGVAFDLLIVPLLLWPATRRFAFLFSCFFHLFNAYTLRIGIFPYLSIALLLFFLNPAAVGRFFFRRRTPVVARPLQPAGNLLHHKLIVCACALYLFIQLVLPMRSWFYPGNVDWTEEGYRMSWKMMSRTKTGRIHFKVIDPVTRQQWIVDPATTFPGYHARYVAVLPDFAWQYAQHLQKEFTARGYPNAQVYAIGSVSLNRRAPRPLIDSTVNLAAVKWQPFSHATWILPFEQK
jgi:vitamin K-dependent gamma-carboxylase